MINVFVEIALKLFVLRTWICRLNFAQSPIISGLKFFNELQISQSGPPAWSPSRRTCSHDFYDLKKSIDLRRVSTREPWISRRARYSGTTDADMQAFNFKFHKWRNCFDVFSWITGSRGTWIPPTTWTDALLPLVRAHKQAMFMRIWPCTHIIRLLDVWALQWYQ